MFFTQSRFNRMGGYFAYLLEPQFNGVPPAFEDEDAFARRLRSVEVPAVRRVQAGQPRLGGPRGPVRHADAAFCSDVRLQPCSDYDFNDLLVAFDLEIPPAPEPTGLALLAIGIAGVAAARGAAGRALPEAPTARRAVARSSSRTRRRRINRAVRGTAPTAQAALPPASPRSGLTASCHVGNGLPIAAASFSFDSAQYTGRRARSRTSFTDVSASSPGSAPTRSATWRPTSAQVPCPLLTQWKRPDGTSRASRSSVASRTSSTKLGVTIRSANTGVGRPSRRRGGDLVHAAPRLPTAEQALDAQHVPARRVLREPLPQQLGAAVRAHRTRAVVLAIGRGGLSVEHEVGAVVHQRRADAGRGRGHRPHGQRVDRQRRRGVVFRAVDVVVGRAVDQDVRAGRARRRPRVRRGR